MRVTCRRCRNEGHYSNGCQLKNCSNCNSTTHNKNAYVYDGRSRERRYGVNQVQPHLNNNRRKAGAEPSKFRDEKRPRFGENLRDMRYPYQGRDTQRDEKYPCYRHEYRRGDRYPYDNYRREATYPYRSEYYPKEKTCPFTCGTRGPIKRGRLDYPRNVMDNNGQKAAPRIGYTGLPRQVHRKPECSLFRKHQEEANEVHGGGKCSDTRCVCVMTRAQRVAKGNSKEESESEDEDEGDERKSEDSENSDSDDEKDTIEVMDDESEDEPKSQEVRDAPGDLNWKKNREIHHKESGNAKAPKRRRKELKSQKVRDVPEDLVRKKHREIYHENSEELSENENEPRRKQK